MKKRLLQGITALSLLIAAGSYSLAAPTPEQVKKFEARLKKETAELTKPKTPVYTHDDNLKLTDIEKIPNMAMCYVLAMQLGNLGRSEANGRWLLELEPNLHPLAAYHRGRAEGIIVGVAYERSDPGLSPTEKVRVIAEEIFPHFCAVKI